MDSGMWWLIGVALYVVVWLWVARRLFHGHQATMYDWNDQLWRIYTVLGYGLLALFWPLGIFYLIIRGKPVNDGEAD